MGTAAAAAREGLWDQVLAFGQYQHSTLDGKPVVTVFDASSVKAMFDDFAANPDSDIFYDKQHEVTTEVPGDEHSLEEHRAALSAWASDGHAMAWANALAMVVGGQVTRYEAHPGAPGTAPSLREIEASIHKPVEDGVYCYRARVTPRGADPKDGLAAFGFTSPYFIQQRDGHRLLNLTATNDPRMRGAALAYERGRRIAMRRVEKRHLRTVQQNLKAYRLQLADLEADDGKRAMTRGVEQTMAESIPLRKVTRDAAHQWLVSHGYKPVPGSSRYENADGNAGRIVETGSSRSDEWNVEVEMARAGQAMARDLGGPYETLGQALTTAKMWMNDEDSGAVYVYKRGIDYFVTSGKSPGGELRATVGPGGQVQEMTRTGAMESDMDENKELMARAGCMESDSPAARIEKMAAYIRKMEEEGEKKQAAMEGEVAEMRRKMESGENPFAKMDVDPKNLAQNAAIHLKTGNVNDEGGRKKGERGKMDGEPFAGKETPEEERAEQAMQRLSAQVRALSDGLARERAAREAVEKQVAEGQAVAMQRRQAELRRDAEAWAEEALMRGRWNPLHAGGNDTEQDPVRRIAMTRAWLVDRRITDPKAEELLLQPGTFQPDRRLAMTRMTEAGAGIGAPDPRSTEGVHPASTWADKIDEARRDNPRLSFEQAERVAMQRHPAAYAAYTKNPTMARA